MTDLGRAVNAPGITGFAYDNADGVLYISTLSGDVLRWNPTSGSFLAPIHLGGHPSSIAVSPDGAYLLLGSLDQTVDSGGVEHGEIDRLALSDFSVTPLDIPFTSNYPHGIADEHGVSDLAIANTGEVLVTTTGTSGWNPLREFQFNASTVGTQTVSGVSYPGLSPNASMASSEDGRYVAVSAGGGLNLYDAVTNTIVATASPGYTGESALDVNDRASLVLDGGQVFDTHLNAVRTLTSGYGIANIVGGHFSQDGTRLYILDADHQQIRVFDTSSWSDIKDIQLEAGALRPGAAEAVSTSADGRFLFFRTTAGFDSIDLTSPSATAPAAPPKSAPTSTLWSGLDLGLLPIAYGATTISSDNTIAAGQTVTDTFKLTDPANFPSAGPSLFINGSLNVSAALAYVNAGAVYSDYSGDFTGSIVHVGSTGQLTATATDPRGTASGFDAISFSPRIQNDGLWSVSAPLAAYGVANLYVPNASGPQFVNTGTFQVSAAYAYGVTAPGNLQFVNDGHFSVAGASQAVGIELSGGGPYSAFTNTGDFTVTGPAGGSIGLLVRGFYDHLPILNSGTMSAEVAIQVAIDGSPPDTPVIDLTNSGTINGAINLGSTWGPSSDQYPHGAPGSHIVNTGAINGAIHFDNGNDVYDGAGGAQTGGIYLGSGTDDVVLGNDGETVYGGSGFEDIVGGTGADTVVAGDGDAVIDGGAGVDTVAFSGHASAYTVTPSGPGDTVFGPLGAAVSVSNVEILQFADEQMVLGPAGETLTARAGGDTLIGGGGADTASYADAGSAVGVDLNDQGVSQNTGGAGSDTLVSIENLTGSAFNDSLTGDGNDNVIHGGDGGDTLRGGAGSDQLYGGNSDDVLIGGPGNDILDGGPGHDYVVYTDAPSAVAVDLNAGYASGGDGVDALTSIEGVYGTAFNDNLVGDANRNDIHGGDGGDTIVGGAGDDVLFGEGGDDVLLGGPGDDILDGGAGRNYTSYSDAPSAVAIDLNITNSYQGTGGAGSDWLINIQDVFGSAFNDTIVGDNTNNHIFGWTGGDTLNGGGGADDITGGAGADVLTGGSGNDTFYFDALSDSTVAAPDLITDFSPGDRIYLSNIDADTSTPGDQPFHIGATPGHTGDLVISYDGVNDKTTLWLYVDSDTTPDARITLLGDHSAMTAADFGL